MTKLILALILTALPLQVIAAEPRKTKKPSSTDVARTKLPKSNPCAEYGAGFVRVEGSSTCIRIGGSIGVGAGVGR
jgi:hypothetical protein